MRTLKEANARIKELEARCEEYRQNYYERCSQLEAEVVRFKSLFEDAEAALKVQADQVKNLQARCEEYRKVNADLIQGNTAKAARIKELTREVEKQQLWGQRLTEQLEDQERQTARANEKYHTVSEMRATLKNEVLKLGYGITEDLSRGTIEISGGPVQQTVDICQNYYDRCRQLEAEIKKLKAVISGYEAVNANEVRRREVKIAELEKETVDLREEVNRLNKHISKLGDARVEANNLRRTVDELRQTPSLYQTIVDAHCEKIAELRKDIDMLKASREEALKSLDHFKAQCRIFGDQVRERNLAVSNIKEELETWREHAIKSDKRLKDADTAICEQAEQIESLKKDYDRACSEISKLHNWLNDAEQHLARKIEDRKNAEMVRQWSRSQGTLT